MRKPFVGRHTLRLRTSTHTASKDKHTHSASENKHTHTASENKHTHTVSENKQAHKRSYKLHVYNAAVKIRPETTVSFHVNGSQTHNAHASQHRGVCDVCVYVCVCKCVCVCVNNFPTSFGPTHRSVFWI